MDPAARLPIKRVPVPMCTMMKMLMTVTAALALTGCAGSDPEATRYDAEEAQVPGSGATFATGEELLTAARPLLHGHKCGEIDTDMYGMEYTTCDDDEYDSSAGVRLSVGLDEEHATETAEGYWATNRGMDYTVIRDDNWVVSGPAKAVEQLHADLAETVTE